jgi:hypothetical protein
MTQHDTRGGGQAVRPAGGARVSIRGDRGLRANAFAVVVMLLLQYGLGIWVNVYATLPASDQGKGTFAAFGAAVADGPVALTLHAVLGTLLLVAAVSHLIRAALARKAATTVIAAVALLAIGAAWLSGARFTGSAANGASFGMAIAAAVALLCYVIILFVPRLTEGPGR